MRRFVLAWFLFCSSTALATNLESRAQSSVVCPAPEFSWANNEKGMNPCHVAAYTQGACTTNEFVVIALTERYGYDINLENANECSCSWATYNLLQACTACQAGAPRTWAHFETNCSAFRSATTYFPTIPLEGETTIPFWAANDPSTWNNAQFNVAQAKSLADETHADLNPSPSTAPRNATPIGAIIGGVLGGLAVIVIGLVSIIVILRRNRKAQRPNTGGDARSHRPPHWRSVSDLSSKTTTSYGGGMRPFFPSLQRTPPSPTIRTHLSGGSQHSLSYFGSAASTHAPTVTQVLPVSVSAPLAVGNREDTISPFTLRSPISGSSPRSHRKGPSETSGTSSITTIGLNRPESPETNPSPNRRPRMNPPAYTPPTSPIQATHQLTPQSSSTQLAANARREQHGHGHRPGHVEKGSRETTMSWDSTSGQSNISADGSISAIHEVVERMGLTRAETTSGRGGTDTMSTGLSRQLEHTLRQATNLKPGVVMNPT